VYRCRGRLQTARGSRHTIWAAALGIPLVVEFVWQNNEKATHPNVTGTFKVS
jgi:hypothetical protein